jgi:hypothetical protein
MVMFNIIASRQGIFCMNLLGKIISPKKPTAMKATSTVILMAGICAAMFSACKKSDYMTPDASTATTSGQTTRLSDGSTVNLKFDAAAMNTTAVTVYANGHGMADMGGLRQVNLYAPVMETGLALRAGNYDNLVTDLKLAEGSNVPFLHLRGRMSANDDGDQMMGRSIDFLVSTPMQVKANSGVISVTSKTTFMELLNLHLDRLGANIPAEMWQKALDESSYVITISADSNPELYRMMMNNLQTMLMPVSGTTTSTPSYYQAAPQMPTQVVKDLHRMP